MVFWDNSNYQSYELAAQGEDGLAVVAVLYEVNWHALVCLSQTELKDDFQSVLRSLSTLMFTVSRSVE